MKHWFYIVAAIVVATFQDAAFAGQEGDPVEVIEINQMAFNSVDDQEFSSKLLDVSEWETLQLNQIPSPSSIGWLRTNLALSAQFREATSPLAVYIEGPFSSEIYWNGVLLGKNGLVGNTKKTEVPGARDARFFLPAALIEKDLNSIAIRFSARSLEQFPGAARMRLKIGPYLDDRHERIIGYLPALLMIGAIVAGAVYFGTIYVLQRREKAALWLGLLFLAVALQFSAEIYRGIFSYPYPIHTVRLFTVFGFSVFAGVFLVLFVSERFGQQKYIKTLVTAATVISVAIPLLSNNMDTSTYFVILIYALLALGIAVTAWHQGQHNAAALSLGLLLFCGSFIVGPSVFLDGVYYYAMTVLAIALFVLQAEAFRLARQRSLEMAQLSSRLELELLKRHIQPHFIMNTLTALSEWITESPPTGVKMIQELAQEFRILNDIAGKKLVPLSRELELCRAHVALMSYRNDRRFSLETELVDTNAKVPPAIFHTLIENALTHNRYKIGNTIVFRLTQTAGPETQMTYVFTVPAGERVLHPDGDEARTGLGVTYIRARLDEACAGKYHLVDGPTDEGGWQTIINVNLYEQESAL